MTGGTGVLGNAIGRRIARSHNLIVLSRGGKLARSQIDFPCEIAGWDGRSELSIKVLEGVDGVIHLAGQNIAKGRWTSDRKQEIRASRIQPLEWLGQALAGNGRQLKVLISTSAVGYYGDRGDELLNESAAPGDGFLSQLCQDWERAAVSIHARRTAILRLGVVLSARGGFLEEVSKKFRRFGATRLGSGQQFLSWVHIDDVVEVVAQALVNPALLGPINVVSPNPVRNDEFTHKLAKLTKSFRLPPVPGLILRLLFGEMSELLLGSQKVKPEQLEKLKWNFKYADIDKALGQLASAL
jgi:uncharacterized protein (TIGR01777 family)